jgi:hypothetical protein
MNPHKQVLVDYFDGKIEVNEGISELIWKSGITTSLSCEDNVDNCIWICFDLWSFKKLISKAWEHNI